MTRISDVLLQHGRALEWLTSCALLAFALTLALPGDTLVASPSFQGFTDAGLDEAAIAMPLSWVAAMRMAGLYINGAWRRSPFLRMAGAIVGSGVFGCLSLMFAIPYLQGTQQGLTTGVGVYAVLCAFDLLAAYRTGADVGHAKRAG
ncbi:hypothetical protein [Frigidibacter sp. MR17.24]|uniref:hypothetical protein n=1 Tax=Frigidibacter sp. MR17.24 TaxID=3127345 RepID=UPI003012C2EA